MPRPWKSPSAETTALAERLQRERSMPRAAAFCLARIGFTESGDIDRFLNPRLKGLADPHSLNQVDIAVERVWRAVDAGEIIFIHGDYDVDGITGTAFLTRTLESLGAKVHPYVPHRDRGYGIGPASLDEVRKSAARLVITVDCGMTALAEVDSLRGDGIDVIILDHHHAGERLPQALAIVNPRLNHAIDRFGNLAAVGVAAKFLHALAAARPGSLDPEVYKEALQFVALGTIADVVPLVEENRILVAFGLRKLAESRLAGVQALKAMARLPRRKLTATDVAFTLAPRINAVGRMGDAGDALRLLLADDPAEAYRLAEHIESMNALRRKVDQSVLQEALAQLQGVDPLPAAIVVWSDTWPAGVVGIVASRLVDRYQRPTIVIAMKDNLGRASGRSVPGVSLPPLLDGCADLLEEHGGHAQAAGFSIRAGNLEAFRERFQKLTAELDAAEIQESWDLDAIVELGEMDSECVDWLERLGPFGEGNPEPLFGGRGLVLAEPPTVVGKTHLKLVFQDGSRQVRGIAFRQGNRVEEVARAGRVDAVFHATFDTWRGGQEIQLVVRELGTG